MSLWRQLTRGLRNLVDPAPADRDIADEVEHYLDEAAAGFEADGLSPEQARRAARLQVGSVAAARQQVRTSSWEHGLDTFAADLRYGGRRLYRNPLFTIVAAATLALGIGAATALFSVLNPVLFQPLPYPEADQLVTLWDGQNSERANVTFGSYRELRERNRSFESIAVMRPLQLTLTGVAEPERLDGQFVTASYFHTLGLQPARGRSFQEADDRPNSAFVVLISDGLWRRRFGSDPAIVGRQIALNEIPATVIGVLPGHFENVLSPTAELWATLRYDPALPLTGREWGHHLRMIARLKPATSLEQARVELDAIARTTIEEFRRPAWASLAGGFVASRLQDDLTRAARPILLAVLGAVILLLTLVAVNVTNLLLARGAERRTELAVRAALGASRWRLVRQLLTESLLLALLGGGGGTFVAYAAVEAATTFSPPELPRAGAIAVDRGTLLFALGLTVLVGVVIGGVSAIYGARAEAQGGIQQRSTRIAGGQRRTRAALVVVQVSLAVILLTGAGLMLRSLQHLFDVPPGFEPAHLLTMQVQTAGRRFADAGTTHRFFAQVLDRVEGITGVTGAAFTSQLPLTGDEDLWGVGFESVPTMAGDDDPSGYRYAVSPGYFAAMGIPLRKGRLLDASDDARASRVVVVNESFARRRLEGLDPIGQRLRIGPSTDPWYTVVGVVGDVKQTSLAVTRADGVYMTAAQWARFADNARWLVVRTSGDAAALTPAVRRAIWSVDKDQPILRVATMDERVTASAAERRFASLLFQAFAAVALLLAAIGTYGLVSGSVSERTREIGIRVALGASRHTILGRVLGEGLRLTGLGVLIGVAGAALSSRALVTLLFGISPLDTATYLGVVALLAGVSVVACAMPALRAARVQPTTALRAE